MRGGEELEKVGGNVSILVGVHEQVYRLKVKSGLILSIHPRH